MIVELSIIAFFGALLGIIGGFLIILLRRWLFIRKARNLIENQSIEGARIEDFIKSEDLPIKDNTFESEGIDRPNKPEVKPNISNEFKNSPPALDFMDDKEDNIKDED